MTITDFIRRIEQQQKEQDHIYHNAAVRYGLSDTGMWVLYNVYTASDTITQQELCRQCFFPKQTVNTAIARLIKSGCMTLEAIPGTRNQKKILLTAKGAELAGKTVGHLIEAEERAYAALTPEELQTYLDMTTRLTAALREETEKTQGDNV